MSEEELIEALGELRPDWRDYWDCPFEAADELGLDLGDEDDVRELRFD